jgi:hypothetical protein
MTVPIVSKKSESMIVKTASKVARTPMVANALKLRPLNAFARFGISNHDDGSTAVPGAVEGTYVEKTA